MCAAFTVTGVRSACRLHPPERAKRASPCVPDFVCGIAGAAVMERGGGEAATERHGGCGRPHSTAFCDLTLGRAPALAGQV